jgi:ubiquinone/menaquinone biosynthesis C-methylase UbiE
MERHRDIFEHAAQTYERWYTTPHGQRVDQAERALLESLLTHFPEAHSVIEVGCGTGHFTAWLAERGLRVVGVDRSPAMLAAMRQRCTGVPVVLGDAQSLPYCTGAVDVVVFITTLEFLADPVAALAEATRVARQGVLLVVLNRWSLGGLSRRWGQQVHQPLLGQARDYSVVSLWDTVQQAIGQRVYTVYWASTLFPAGLWWARAPVPLGDIIGMAVLLIPPATEKRGRHGVTAMHHAGTAHVARGRSGRLTLSVRRSPMMASIQEQQKHVDTVTQA